VIRVFFARSPNSSTFELGPFFFVMHTTFIPVFSFLSIVALSWLAKITLCMTAWFLGKARQEQTNPLNLTAAFAALIGAIVGVVLFVFTIAL
jgi:hypothetical protein